MSRHTSVTCTALMLANLLWAGYGVNRPETGGPTAPSANNSHEAEIYVAMADGLYVYEAKAMKLRPEQRITLSQTVGYPKK